MTPQERIDWRIANAAAIMKVSKEEAARVLDATLGPDWREKFKDREPAPSATDTRTAAQQ